MQREHTGLYIDPATNDLAMDTTNNLRLAHNAEAVGQHVRQRLKTFQGEWFLDKNAGVPWLDQILGFRYNPALAEAVVKASIMGTDGVADMLSISVSFDFDPRRLNIREIELRTVYDTYVTITPRKTTVTPPQTPEQALVFSEQNNSQYLPLVGGL